MQAVPNSKQFYFVNKTEKSVHLSRSLPHENSAVQRHVQTGRKRIRHVKNTQTTNECASALKLLPPTTALTLPQHDLQVTDQPVTEIETSSSDLEVEKAHSSLSPVSRKALQDASQRVESLLFQKTLHKIDPFNTTSVLINESVAGLLHYYKYYHHPSQWPNEMALLRQGVYVFQDSVSNVIKTAISDRLTMSCLLSSAACRLQFIDRLPSRRIAGRENYYINEALQLMASFITTADLDDTDQLMQCILCMSFLSSAEAYRGDMIASKAHMNAAGQLLKSRGGLACVVDQNLQGQLAMGDLFLSCVYLRPCMFDCSYDPGPAKPLHLTDNELAAPCVTASATSLLDRPKDFVSPELRTVVEDLLESHTVKSRILLSSMLPTRAMQVTHWITLRNMAIRNRLLALTLANLKHHALRITIIMWTLFAMNFTGRANTVKIMAPQLKDVLSEIPSSEWTGNEDVKLWIVLVGLYCANEGSEASEWFMREYHNLSYILSTFVTTSTSGLAEQLELFQRKFFFDASVQRARTRVLAEKSQHNSD